MKIEEGKKYIDGEGTIVGPMERCHLVAYMSFQWQHPFAGYRTYSSEGKYLTDGDHPFDLVAEYKALPVFIKPSAYFSSEEKIPTNDDCMAYTEQNNDDTSLPFLNIFKPIRTIHAKTPAKFLARADDGSYLFEVGGRYKVQRVDADDVDDQFENVPDQEPTKALIYLCQNVVTGGKYIRSIKPVEDKLLSVCELSYVNEGGWQVRDLEGDN